MATDKNKRRIPVFTKAEVADRKKLLIQERYNLVPDGVNEFGYYYEASQVLDKLNKSNISTKKKNA